MQTFSRPGNRVPAIFFGVILVLVLVAAAMFIQDQVFRPSGSFVVHYHYTAESTYEDILVNETTLTYTHFSDVSGKCAQWIRQSPCWDEQDLRTSVYPLTAAESGQVSGTLRTSGFMDLNGTYGGAGKGMRNYPVVISATRDGVQRTVIYQSFPDADPEPAAFAAVRDAVIRLKETKAGRE